MAKRNHTFMVEAYGHYYATSLTGDNIKKFCTLISPGSFTVLGDTYQLHHFMALLPLASGEHVVAPIDSLVAILQDDGDTIAYATVENLAIRIYIMPHEKVSHDNLNILKYTIDFDHKWIASMHSDFLNLVIEKMFDLLFFGHEYKAV